MEAIALIGGILGIATGFISLLAVLWRVSQSAARVEHQIDKLELTVNGIRERMEHINTRLSNEHRELERSLTDVENYLHKNTAYERRHN